jgi:hypothetical protein
VCQDAGVVDELVELLVVEVLEVEVLDVLEVVLVVDDELLEESDVVVPEDLPRESVR